MTKADSPMIGVVGRKNNFSPLTIDLDRLEHDSRQSEISSSIFVEHLIGNPERMEELAEETTEKLRTLLSK